MNDYQGLGLGEGTDQKRQEETFRMRQIFCILTIAVITPMFFEERLFSSKLITKKRYILLSINYNLINLRLKTVTIKVKIKGLLHIKYVMSLQLTYSLNMSNRSSNDRREEVRWCQEKQNRHMN